MIVLAHDGMTHVMGFAKAVADGVVFMGEGAIVVENDPVSFFENPQHERSKDFLG